MDTVRIATWNVWGRFGPWEQRQAAIESVLLDLGADVVCLQEVWSTDEADQLDHLSDVLGCDRVRSPQPAEHGVSNAVLSRWPILDHDWAFLDEGSGPGLRTVLHASIEAPFGMLDVFTTHLEHRFDRSAVRAAQAADVAAYVADRRRDPTSAFPPVLTGDLNAVPDADEVRALKGLAAPPVPGLVFSDAWEQAGDGSAGATWSRHNPHQADSTWPDRRLDYVLVGWPRPKPLGNPVRAWVFGTRPVAGVVASDHYGVAAELRAV